LSSVPPADRLPEQDHHLSASIFLSELKQDHLNVLRVWIHRHMKCAECNVKKPLTTGFNSRWHRCSSVACRRLYCSPHGAALGGRSPFSRTRRCGGSNTATELLGDS
jgi:hypothetical protein